MKKQLQTKRGIAGFTVVELLIAATILTILLGMTTAFFVGNARVTKRNQARNDVESKLRSVAEIVAQDLENAGSTVIFANGITTNVDSFCAADGDVQCIELPTAATDKLRVFYTTSLRSTLPCRRIDYRLTTNNILQRVESSRSGVNCKQLSSHSTVNFTPSNADYTNSAIAENITGFDILYHCSNGGTQTDPATCYSGGGFPRQADITVQGRSDALSSITGSVTFTATTPNLKR